jgi:hypothetical protein
METRLTAKPVEQVVSAIQALDLESVKLRVMDAELGEGWTREYADCIESAYKNYLTMVVKYQDEAEDILPSKDVDEFWHTHILQTMKYADDCQAVFGTFLHHNPHVGKLSQADLDKRVEHAEKTRQFYEREFGTQWAAKAWAGNVSRIAKDALLNVAIQVERAAVSAVTIRPENAAVSAVTIRAENAAVSAVTIRPENAAVSAVTIRAENAAVSAVTIRPENAAVSAVTIRAENAAVSAVTIRPENAAVSAVTIRAENAAVSAVTIRPENAAVSAIAVRPESAAVSGLRIAR